MTFYKFTCEINFVGCEAEVIVEAESEADAYENVMDWWRQEVSPDALLDDETEDRGEADTWNAQWI